MFGFKKKSPEAPATIESKPTSKAQKIGAGVLVAASTVIIGGGLGAASVPEKIAGSPVAATHEVDTDTTEPNFDAITPDITTYVIPSTEVATPTEVPSTTETPVTTTAPTTTSSEVATTDATTEPAAPETSTNTTDYSAAPAHSDADEARLGAVHESTSYKTLTSEQKATFDQAAEAPYEAFLELDYKERAMYANVILRGSYQDVHNMTGASDGKLDTTYFDKHTWADGMGARPDQIADKVEGPANYIGILIAFAYYQGGETGAKLLASAYVDTSGSNEHFNEMLSALSLMQDGGMPVTADRQFLEGKSYLDRVVANYKVSNSTVSDTPTTIYTADLNNPKKTPSDIQLSLAYSRFETPESGYSMWIIVPNGLNYPTDPNYDASFAPAPGQ